MVSKIFIVTLYLSISLVLATDEKPQDSSENKQTVTAENKEKKISDLKKAIDQEQKLNLELSIEKTKLDEFTKLKEADKIDATTLSVTRWQKNLLNNISKTKKKIEELTVKEAVSKTLVEQLKSSTNSPGKDEKQIKDKITKIVQALKEQQKVNLELAVAAAKLEQLQKQKEAEKIDVTTAAKLTNWQTNLLNDITKAKEKKGDLTIGAAVAKTRIDQLKQQLTAFGGSLDSITSTSSMSDKQISEKTKKAEDNKWKIDKDLALAETELQQLEKRKESEKINPQITNLTRKQKDLLNNIEKVKEKKYNLALKSAVEKTLIEQLKLLNSNGNSSIKGSSLTK